MANIEKRERNRDIVQLFKVGWTKYAIGKLVCMDKSNVRRVVIRDFDKYPSPTVDDLRMIEGKYKIKVGEIKNIVSPVEKQEKI